MVSKLSSSATILKLAYQSASGTPGPNGGAPTAGSGLDALMPGGGLLVARLFPDDPGTSRPNPPGQRPMGNYVGGLF